MQKGRAGRSPDLRIIDPIGLPIPLPEQWRFRSVLRAYSGGAVPDFHRLPVHQRNFSLSVQQVRAGQARNRRAAFGPTGDGVPFSFVEGASFIYDYDGKPVRTIASKMSDIN